MASNRVLRRKSKVSALESFATTAYDAVFGCLYLHSLQLERSRLVVLAGTAFEAAQWLSFPLSTSPSFPWVDHTLHWGVHSVSPILQAVSGANLDLLLPKVRLHYNWP